VNGNSNVNEKETEVTVDERNVTAPISNESLDVTPFSDYLVFTQDLTNRLKNAAIQLKHRY
jgi:hypothetical protein